MTLPSCLRQTRTWPHYWRTALSAWPLASLWSGEWDDRRFGRRGNVRYFLQVRQRHCKPRPHLPQWSSGGKRWSCDGWTILSSSPGNFIELHGGEWRGIMMLLLGALQTLCPQCYLDPDQSALYHVDHIPPEKTLQRLHQDEYWGSESPPTFFYCG